MTYDPDDDDGDNWGGDYGDFDDDQHEEDEL